MRNNRIRLTESQLHRVIKESVLKVLNEDGLVYSTNKKLNRTIQNSNPFNVKRQIQELENELASITPSDYQTHAVGSGEWSIEIYDVNHNLMKEFVGNNGTPNGWNIDGVTDDLWAKVHEWESTLKPQQIKIQRQIEKLNNLV